MALYQLDKRRSVIHLKFLKAFLLRIHQRIGAQIKYKRNCIVNNLLIFVKLFDKKLFPEAKGKILYNDAPVPQTFSSRAHFSLLSKHITQREADLIPTSIPIIQLISSFHLITCTKSIIIRFLVNIMSIVEAAEKQEKLISRIKETIGTLQKEKLWNDDKFFDEVKDVLKGELNEEEISKVVANALFNLKISQPKIEHVKRLIQAFPDSLKCENTSYHGYLPIVQLTFYPKQDNGKKGSHYVTALALEGLKHNVGGENMRGGLLCVSNEKNILQRLSMQCSDDWYLEALKDLRNHKLLLKKDILDFSLLYYSCIGKTSVKRFRYFIKWDHEALVKTTVDGVPLLHAVIQLEDEESAKRSFKRCVKYSLPHCKQLLFLKDDKDKTAFEQATTKFGEKETMTMLREIIEENSAYPILHQVIVHAPKYYNLFLRWFPHMFRLRDENGRTPTQVMFSMNREFLQENPTFWINQTADQLEEKDPKTRLRPFASVAYGMLGDLDLSYQILRMHPSVIDVILEQREELADANNTKKRNAEEQDLEHSKRNKKEEETTEATA